MKRVLALALVLMMAISIALPITALAESNENELKYYFVSYGTGIFNEDYIMSRTDNTEFEEYVIRDVNLYANKHFYIYSTYDGKNCVKSYPGSRAGFPLDTSLLIEVDGVYDIYFRPNFDGGSFYDNSGWVYNCLYVDDSKAVEKPKEYLYRDKFLEFCQSSASRMVPYSTYDELYYHRDSSGEIDWALVEAKSNGLNNLWLTCKIGNRIIHQVNSHYPFMWDMGIYDVKKGRMFDLLDINSDDYTGFTRIYNEIGVGRLVGDINNDNEISILDTTLIQRCEVGLNQYDDTDIVTEQDILPITSYYSDFNFDDERNILDATCMQRYLSGGSYPIG